MFYSKFTKSKAGKGVMMLAMCLFSSVGMVMAKSDDNVPLYSPAVNGEALRGLSAIGSAEPMGAGRITLGIMAPWYKQETGYLNTPNTGASVFTGTGALSYGANSYIDLFASITGFGSNNYSNTNSTSGLGTIRAGAQGSLPFPEYSFIRLGGQATIIGGTADNQINTFRSDGYNYFDTRTGYDFMGKLMQTIQFGGEDWGMKVHINEAGVTGISETQPALLLLGAGLQANVGFFVLGTELNSRTQYNDMAFRTDPLWFTPSLNFRTPYDMNLMAGIDVSISDDRTNGNPRALEPYRIFGSLAFSIDALASKRKAELAQKQKAAKEKADLEAKAEQANQQAEGLALKAVNDSIDLANEKENARIARENMKGQMDSLDKVAIEEARANKMALDSMSAKAVADSVSLAQAARNLAFEKEKRSDAENKLLSTGELLLDAVYFESGKTAISINSKSYLNIIAKMLLRYPKLQIEVAGYTDNKGSPASNLILSQGRADAVRIYLVEVAPALRSNLSAKGYGIAMPKADNSTREGRLANRRVELHVINKDALMEYSQIN